MPRCFHRYTETDAPTATARRVLAEQRERRGCVTNLLAVLAESDVALAIYAESSQRYRLGLLDDDERQVVMMTATRLNVSHYCQAAQAAQGKAAGMADECLQALASGRPLADPKLEALRRFTEAAYYCRGKVDSGTWAGFNAAGYSHAHAFEVLAGIALKVFSNFAARMTAVDVDTACGEPRPLHPHPHPRPLAAVP